MCMLFVLTLFACMSYHAHIHLLFTPCCLSHERVFYIYNALLARSLTNITSSIQNVSRDSAFKELHVWSKLNLWCLRLQVPIFATNIFVSHCESMQKTEIDQQFIGTPNETKKLLLDTLKIVLYIFRALNFSTYIHINVYIYCLIISEPEKCSTLYH